MANLVEIKLRHARHYVEVAAYAEQCYRQGGINQEEGLAFFDTERPQIDAAWTWVRSQPRENGEIAILLNAFAYATIEIGDLRYAKAHERIPQLEAALAVLPPDADPQLEAAWLGNLGLAYYCLGNIRQAITYHERHL